MRTGNLLKAPSSRKPSLTDTGHRGPLPPPLTADRSTQFRAGGSLVVPPGELFPQLGQRPNVLAQLYSSNVLSCCPSAPSDMTESRESNIGVLISLHFFNHPFIHLVVVTFF